MTHQVAVELFARQMWIADELANGNDGVEAATQWDDDELLVATYQRWEAMASEAVRIEVANRLDEVQE